MSDAEKIIDMIGKLDAKMDKLGSEVGILGSEVGKLDAKVEKLDAKVEKLDLDLAEVREHVILIEQDHGKQLNALFDSYELLYTISCEIRTGMTKLQATQDHHDLRLLRLEAKIS